MNKKGILAIITNIFVKRKKDFLLSLTFIVTIFVLINVNDYKNLFMSYFWMFYTFFPLVNITLKSFSLIIVTAQNFFQILFSDILKGVKDIVLNQMICKFW